MTATPQTAQTLDRGLQILEMLAGVGDDLTITEVASVLGVHRTIAYRLMATLEQRDFVSRSSSNRFQLGTKIIRLSSRIGGQLRSIAREPLLELSKETDETVHLVVAAGAEVVFIDAFESSRNLRVISRTGQSLPAHATSVGKAILAMLSEDELLKLYPKKQLVKLATNTITSRSELFKQLESVRQVGYSASSEESEAGVGSIGVAILDQRNTVRAALSVAAPISRITPAVVPKLVLAAQRAAKKIGSLL